MKKLIIFLGIAIAIIIIITIFVTYIGYKDNYNSIKKENMQFESYYEQETYGNNIATLINKAIDNNLKNNIEKDSNGKYIENDTNSINIDIKMTDIDKTYNMESIYNGGIPDFITYYGQIKFKGIKIEYHQKTGRIKYMLFEQITE